jgi:hypothetical protein
MGKIVLGDIMRGTQSLFPDADLVQAGGDTMVTYVRETTDQRFEGGIRFLRARAFRFRAEAHCTVWHVEGAYNQLVEVEDSPWVAELDRPGPPSRTWEMHHYMVYIEDSGCYEVASESWEWLPEVEI